MPHDADPIPGGVPEGFHTATPYLICGDAAGAIDFYKAVFGATELMRLADHDGKIRHAEVRIGDSPVMIADEAPEFPEVRSPLSLGGSPVHVFLYVGDVDAVMDRAVASGAEVLEPAEDHPSEGDRRGGFKDPFGFVWWVATHVEDVSREEIQNRLENPA
jgi:PhnB protein